MKWVNSICDALRNLVPLLQFKKRGENSSMGVFHVFYIVQMVPATLLKLTLLHGCFSRFYIVQMVPATLLKLTLLHGCFSRFYIVQMVPNRSTHHIYSNKK